jgi:hypothetical protein
LGERLRGAPAQRGIFGRGAEILVTKTTVVRSACHSCSRSLLSLKRVISSSAANGSSINSSAGSVTSARAIETRMRMPPDNSRG